MRNPFTSFTRATMQSIRGNPRLRWGIERQRLQCELLEDRCLLSVGPSPLELFSVMPALFVENQGQWADASVRMSMTGTG